MKKLTTSIVAPCNVDAFWRVFMDPAYLHALYKDALGFRAFEILAIDEVSRKLRITPKMNLPEPLAKIVGDAFAYEEHGTLDREKSEWVWKMVQPANARLPELIVTSGRVNVTAVGADKCRRDDELLLEGKLFGLGRLIESAGEKEARAAWAKEEPFFTRWLADRKS